MILICVFRLKPDPDPTLTAKSDPDPDHNPEDYITLCTLGKFIFKKNLILKRNVGQENREVPVPVGPNYGVSL